MLGIVCTIIKTYIYIIYIFFLDARSCRFSWGGKPINTNTRTSKHLQSNMISIKNDT